MAELLAPAGWEIGSLPAALRDGLPDGYLVVLGATVWGRVLETLVVGPQGLFVLHTCTWQDRERPGRLAFWSRWLAGRREAENGNPRAEAERDDAALHAFLRDEFPHLGVAIYYLAVPAEPEEWPIDGEDLGLNVVDEDVVAEAIAATPSEGEPLDEEVRESLAVALHERHLTASQRAREPFVFRSGGALGSGKKVWTVQAMVAHIDRHPDDGIFHLRNGTLAGWLEDQGAAHLAELARVVMRQRESDSRVLVETFVIGTGLVRRPRLAVRPSSLHLGYVLSGEACHGRLWLRKGRGRGYLFGSLDPSETWLRVEPDTFRGGPAEVLVRADAEALPISRRPHRAELMVDSSATADPIGVPVLVRVVGMPSALNRHLIRPLVGALVAGAVGAAVGWALGRWGAAVPSWLATQGLRPAASVGSLDPALFWMAVVGLFWAALGAVRGWRQPARWPVSYAVARWLVRTVAWALALAVLAAIAELSWVAFGPQAGSATLTLSASVLMALALSVVPAVVAEVRSGQKRRADRADRARPGRSRYLRRPITLALVGVALLILVAVGVPLVGRALEGVDVRGTAASVQEWVAERWAGLEATVDDWADRLLLRGHERDSQPLWPLATAQPTPQPASTATPGPAPPATAGP